MESSDILVRKIRKREGEQGKPNGNFSLPPGWSLDALYVYRTLKKTLPISRSYRVPVFSLYTKNAGSNGQDIVYIVEIFRLFLGDSLDHIAKEKQSWQSSAQLFLPCMPGFYS